MLHRKKDFIPILGIRLDYLQGKKRTGIWRWNMRKAREKMEIQILWWRQQSTWLWKNQNTSTSLTMPGPSRWVSNCMWYIWHKWHNVWFQESLKMLFRLQLPDNSWLTRQDWVPGWLLSWTLRRMWRWISYIGGSDLKAPLQVVEEVLKDRWKFAQTYSLGGATAEERQPVWYDWSTRCVLNFLLCKVCDGWVWLENTS